MGFKLFGVVRMRRPVLGFTWPVGRTPTLELSTQAGVCWPGLVAFGPRVVASATQVDTRRGRLGPATRLLSFRLRETPQRIGRKGWSRRAGEIAASKRRFRLVPQDVVPMNGPTELPHAGVHAPSAAKGFFEGWYIRVVLPSSATSLAFMYSIEDGRTGRIQVLSSAGDELLVSRALVDGFFPARCHLPTTGLRIGQWGRTSDLLSEERARHARSLAPTLFQRHILTGYQLSMQQHHGAVLTGDVDMELSQVSALRGNVACSFDMQLTPMLTWGLDGSRSTGTWLTRFQIFEPGWQIISAFALSTGTLQDWHGRVFRFDNAPTYIEKNWGSAFPSRWFWLQCNVFDEIREQAPASWPGESDTPLAMTGVGARRELCWPGQPGRVLTTETIGMIAFHWRGLFWEFAPWNCRFIRWSVRWGQWHVEAQGTRYSVTVSAETSEPGTLVLGPTRSGMDFVVRDGTRGTLRLVLYDLQQNAVLLDALCYERAAVEIGGDLVTRADAPTWSDGRDELPTPLKTMFLLGERPGRAIQV